MSEGMRSIDFSNISVLVAEYNNYMRQTIRSILRTFNIGDIIEMQNPDDAWDMFCATPPDVVFADWAPALMVWAFCKKSAVIRKAQTRLSLSSS